MVNGKKIVATVFLLNQLRQSSLNVIFYFMEDLDTLILFNWFLFDFSIKNWVKIWYQKLTSTISVFSIQNLTSVFLNNFIEVNMSVNFRKKFHIFWWEELRYNSFSVYLWLLENICYNYTNWKPNFSLNFYVHLDFRQLDMIRKAVQDIWPNPFQE